MGIIINYKALHQKLGCFISTNNFIFLQYIYYVFNDILKLLILLNIKILYQLKLLQLLFILQQLASKIKWFQKQQAQYFYIL